MKIRRQEQQIQMFEGFRYPGILRESITLSRIRVALPINFQSQRQSILSNSLSLLSTDRSNLHRFDGDAVFGDRDKRRGFHEAFGNSFSSSCRRERISSAGCYLLPNPLYSALQNPSVPIVPHARRPSEYVLFGTGQGDQQLQWKNHP